MRRRKHSHVSYTYWPRFDDWSKRKRDGKETVTAAVWRDIWLKNKSLRMVRASSNIWGLWSSSFMLWEVSRVLCETLYFKNGGDALFSSQRVSWNPFKKSHFPEEIIAKSILESKKLNFQSLNILEHMTRKYFATETQIVESSLQSFLTSTNWMGWEITKKFLMALRFRGSPFVSGRFTHQTTTSLHFLASHNRGWAAGDTPPIFWCFDGFGC